MGTQPLDSIVTSGTWDDKPPTDEAAGRFGHDIIYVSKNLALDWRPEAKPERSPYKVWKFDRKFADADPLTEVVREGSWSSILMGHKLIYIGGGRVLDFEFGSVFGTPGHYRVWNIDYENKQDDFLPDPKHSEGDLPSYSKGQFLECVFGNRILTWDRVAGVVRMYAFDARKKSNPYSFVARSDLAALSTHETFFYPGDDRILLVNPLTAEFRVFGVNRDARGREPILTGLPLTKAPLTRGTFGSNLDYQPGDVFTHFDGRIALRHSTLAKTRTPDPKIKFFWCHAHDPTARTAGVTSKLKTPGLSLLQTGGKTWVVAELKQLFPDGGTILDLANRLRLAPSLVLESLLGNTANRPVLSSLFRAAQPGKSVPSDLKKLRRIVRSRSHQYTPLTADKKLYTTKAAYHFWQPKTAGNVPVVVPLSEAFEDLKKAEAERRRAARMKFVGPDFIDELRIQLGRVDTRLKIARQWKDHIDGKTKQPGQEIALLRMLRRVLIEMLERPKVQWDDDEEDDVADKQKVEDLLAKLDKLIDEATKSFLLDPPGGFLQDARAEHKQAAQELLAQVSDPALARNLRILRENVDLAPSLLWIEALDVTRNAYAVLLESALADEAMKHVDQVVDSLGSEHFDVDDLPKTAKSQALLDAVKKVPIAPAPVNMLTAMAGSLKSFTSITGSVVGNMPGPMSLAVAVTHLATPHFVARAVRLPATRIDTTARVFRMLNRAGGLSANERFNVFRAIDEGNMRTLRKVDWTKRFQSGPKWAGFFSLATGLLFVHSVATEDRKTIESWTNIISTGAGFSSSLRGLALALKFWTEEPRFVAIGGRAIGVLGAMAAAVAGGVAAGRALSQDDHVGFGLNMVSTIGGIASFAGFMLTGGLGVTFTGVAAPVGLVMMIVGTAVGLGVALAEEIRQLTTADAHPFFKAALDSFEFGTLVVVKDARPTLKEAFEQVKAAQNPGRISLDRLRIDLDGFMRPIHPERMGHLASAGLKADQVAMLIGQRDNIFVKPKLIELGFKESEL